MCYPTTGTASPRQVCPLCITQSDHPRHLNVTSPPFRLTLVKGWNMAEVQQYAALVDLGQPDFIEIKGVTYCGDSGTL